MRVAWLRRSGNLFHGVLLMVALACDPKDLSVFTARESAGSSAGGAGGAGTGGNPAAAGAPSNQGGSAASPPQDDVVFVLDDFEDGDTRAQEPGGWWYSVNDGSGDQLLEIVDDDRDQSGHSLRTRGFDFTEWGAAIGVDVADVFGAREINVLRFTARSEPPRDVSLHLIESSGERFTRSLTIGASWAEYSVRLDQVYSVVTNEGGDQVRSLDVTTLDELQWFFFIPDPFDFWLDDVVLLQTSEP